MEAVQINEFKTIRDPAFAKRLEQACDASPHCPDMHHGRLTWIVSQLASRFDEKVSVQTVARWMNGEARPRQAKNVKLAQLLDVDSVWLFMGAEPEMSSRDKRARNAMADGAVNVVAGLIQMDGGYPAFPEDGDKRAKQDQVHLYAVIKGAQYAFHVALGAAVEGGWSFTVPADHEHIVMLGIIREGLTFHLVELSADMLAKHGQGSARRTITAVLNDESIAAHSLSGFTARL